MLSDKIHRDTKVHNFYTKFVIYCYCNFENRSVKCDVHPAFDTFVQIRNEAKLKQTVSQFKFKRGENSQKVTKTSPNPVVALFQRESDVQNVKIFSMRIRKKNYAKNLENQRTTQQLQHVYPNHT